MAKMTNNTEPRVVVSMTSFPAAIDYAIDALRSLLAGSRLPDKLVLYVTLEQFGEKGLPAELLRLEAESPIFEIRDYPVDLRSYRKLIPALKDFPNSIIVTVDDDVFYHRHMLRDLLLWHRIHPKAILAHRARRIKLDRPYDQWKKYHWYHHLTSPVIRRHSTLQVGVGGVLYPPHCLDERMMDPELFRKHAPTGDDMWFWAAAAVKGTYVMPVPAGRYRPRQLGKPENLSLRTQNYIAGVDKNSVMMRSILEAYPQLNELLTK